MPCKIDGCDHKVMYPVIQLCQMHYFRFLRTGSYEIVKKPRKPFLQNPAGYKTIYCEESPLSDSRGCVYEHRQVVYEKYGDNLPDCEICGKPTTWATCHIDHKAGNYAEYCRRLPARIGQEAYDALMSDQQARHYTIEQLQQLIETYKQKVRELK